MKDIENSKKESPMLGLTGMGGGVASLMWAMVEGGPYNRLFGWGDNPSGVLGQNSVTDYSSPVQIMGDGANWSSLWVSGNTWRNTCGGVKDNGTLWMWGAGTSGVSGYPPTGEKSSPIQIPGTTWTHVATGGYHTVAPKSDGTLWTWGGNGGGELGQNTSNSPSYAGISSPIQVGTETTWSSSNKFKFATGANSDGEGLTLAIKTNGTLWSWGDNEWGALGHNQATAQATGLSSPTQVGTDTTWNLISSNKGPFVLGIKTNGTLWAWGYNYVGMLGLNEGAPYPTQVNRSSPTQVGTDTTWNGIFAGDKNACATKTDGTLWVWGQNDRGGLGINFGSGKSRSSPTQIPGTTWSSGVMGENFSMWRRNDGTVWTAGLNNQGNLGQNETTWRSSPIQVGTDTDWANEISITQGSLFGLRAALPE